MWIYTVFTGVFNLGFFTALHRITGFGYASMGVHQGHQRMCDKFQHEHFIFQGHLPAQQHISTNIN